MSKSLIVVNAYSADEDLFIPGAIEDINIAWALSNLLEKEPILITDVYDVDWDVASTLMEKQTVLNILRSGEFSICYLSCHGEMVTPTSSSLVFSDGMLTVTEIVDVVSHDAEFLLIVDACYSSNFVRLPYKVVNGTRIQLHPPGDHGPISAFCSSKLGCMSWSSPIGSPFTRNLFSSLSDLEKFDLASLTNRLSFNDSCSVWTSVLF